MNISQVKLRSDNFDDDDNNNNNNNTNNTKHNKNIFGVLGTWFPSPKPKDIPIFRRGIALHVDEVPL